jgi:hypothetical protein
VADDLHQQLSAEGLACTRRPLRVNLVEAVRLWRR